MATKTYANEHPRYKEKAAKDRKKRHQKDYESYARTSDYWKQSSPEQNPFYPKGHEEKVDAFRTMQKERFMYGEPTIFPTGAKENPVMIALRKIKSLTKKKKK